MEEPVRLDRRANEDFRVTVTNHCGVNSLVDRLEG